jgi:hypothetical protein
MILECNPRSERITSERIVKSRCCWVTYDKNDHSMLQYPCGNFIRLFLISKTRKNSRNIVMLIHLKKKIVEMLHRLINNFNSTFEMWNLYIATVMTVIGLSSIFPCPTARILLPVYRDVHVISVGCFVLATWWPHTYWPYPIEILRIYT